MNGVNAQTELNGEYGMNSDGTNSDYEFRLSGMTQYFHPFPHYPEALVYQTSDALDWMLGRKQ